MKLIRKTTLHARLPVKLTWAAGVLIVVFLSVTPQDGLVQVSDKTAHLLAYFAVTLVGVWSASTQPRRMALVMAMSGLGLALEFAQLYVPGRHFEFLDGVANAAGAALALLVYNVVKRS